MSRPPRVATARRPAKEAAHSVLTLASVTRSAAEVLRVFSRVAGVLVLVAQGRFSVWVPLGWNHGLLGLVRLEPAGRIRFLPPPASRDPRPWARGHARTSETSSIPGSSPAAPLPSLLHLSAFGVTPAGQHHLKGGCLCAGSLCAGSPCARQRDMSWLWGEGGRPAPGVWKGRGHWWEQRAGVDVPRGVLGGVRGQSGEQGGGPLVTSVSEVPLVGRVLPGLPREARLQARLGNSTLFCLVCCCHRREGGFSAA